MNSSRHLSILLVTGAVLLGACKMTEIRTPAVLVSSDSETMTELKSVLAQAMDTASVEIGPGDLTQTSVISVLPPRLSPQEDRSTVTPIQFDLMKNGSGCSVVRRETGDEYPIEGITCRAAE